MILSQDTTLRINYFRSEGIKKNNEIYVYKKEMVVIDEIFSLRKYFRCDGLVLKE